MHPPATPVPDICYGCTNEEFFLSLEKMSGGYPLPKNVINGVNPFNCEPSNLPQGIWYLIHSKENRARDLGSWKVKEEACKLLSNSDITGWRRTFECCEGQVPHEHKTNWVMQEYWITQTGAGENSNMKEGCSLCRVFLGGGQGFNHQKEHKSSSLHIAGDTLVQSKESIAPNADDGTASGSASENAGNKDDETGVLAVTGASPDYLVENQPEIDYFSRGDYLELLDLDDPASPSSSSDNTSCVTMSSDECFDSLALLRELDSKIKKSQVQKIESCKLSISISIRTDEVVTIPASPGSSTGNEESRIPAEEILETDLSLPALVDDSKNRGTKVQNQKANRRDESSSSSDDAGTSTSGHHKSQDGERKADKSRKKRSKKNKYMCFMPFYFLL